MRKERLAHTEKSIRKKRISWKKRAVSIMMAAVITAGAAYADAIPVFSVENTTICGQEEHIHGEACYTEKKDLICTQEETAGHTHDAGCYTENSNLICITPESAGHTHGDGCYEKQLVCQLTESDGHTHSDACNTVNTFIGCGKEESEEHTHNDSCNVTQVKRNCGKEESAGHKHGDDCYQKVLICQKEESAGHFHGDSCYQKNQQLTCNKEETAGHTHEESCYQVTKILSCTKAEHTHSTSCYPVETERVTEVQTEKATENVTVEVIETQTEGVSEVQTEESAEQETEAVRDGEPVYLGEYIESITVERKVEGTADTWEKLAKDIKKKTGSAIEIKETDEIRFTLEYKISGKALEGTEAAEYKLPLESKEAKIADKKEAALAQDEKTEIGKIITKTDKTVEITFIEKYLEKNDEGTELKGLYQFKADASELTFDSEGMAELRFEKEESTEKTRELVEAIEVVFQIEEVILESESETESESESELTEEPKLSAMTAGANVTADYEEGVLPEETILQVVELPQDSEEMGQIQTLISGTLTEQKKFAAAVYAFDIEFVNEANEAVVSEGQVTVEVMFNTPAVPADAANTWTLFHITDEGIAEDLTAAETTVISADETGAVTGFKFSSSTFSPYVLVETAEGLSAEQLQANYESYLEEVKKYEESGVDEENWQEADELLAQIMEAYENGELTEENYNELYERLQDELVKYYNTMAESAEGNTWKQLIASGWFQDYSAYVGTSGTDEEVTGEIPTAMSLRKSVMRSARVATPPSGVQVVDGGGSASSSDNKVNISKTIAGTNLENVFDITLKVDTTENIKEIYEDPDMAVVIVMDISQTMNSDFGSNTRYGAAMTAAEQFLDKFAESTNGVSKVGYVAFNTNAHEIFELQSCANATEATALKKIMESKTGTIIGADKYDEAHSRFTNIQAGLRRGWDMLKNATNKNKYIIFLSDGFPTTYCNTDSGYTGYDPYNGTLFKDRVSNKPCTYGTSYSDKAAILARQQAEIIKASGATIFSIGVDVGGQTIQGYIDQTSGKTHSVVDRAANVPSKKNWEIGSATDKSAYKGWLGNSIGSGYYYDSTNASGLSSAYDQIFAQIKNLIEEKAEAQWVANDPMPVGSDSTRMVEFIGFYTKTPELTGGNLSGAYGSGKENTATFDSSKEEINWDLKKSGYQKSTVNGVTVYTYQLVYRVRLKNESDTFAEGTVYDTNNPTKLTYQKKTVTNGNTVISDPESLDFPIPSVKGYLVELQFTKLDSYERPVVGAQFTLKHDTANCSVCRGNGTSTTVEDMTATSGTDGVVKFTGIPSGHIYKLEETHMPNGYYSVGNNYQVTAAYDEVTVTATDKDGNDIDWEGIIINNTQYRLPNTGGPGTTLYTMGGLMTVLATGYLLLYNNKRRGKEAKASSRRV